VQSIKNVKIGQVLYIAKYKIDFELGILFREAPSINKAHIGD
jgi:hypothetical protein